jgi:hypothetical protein
MQTVAPSASVQVSATAQQRLRVMQTMTAMASILARAAHALVSQARALLLLFVLLSAQRVALTRVASARCKRL